jgi:hypothetical protein
MKQRTQPQSITDRLVYYYRPLSRKGSGWHLARVKEEDGKNITVQPLKPGSHYLSIPRENIREIEA